MAEPTRPGPKRPTSDDVPDTWTPGPPIAPSRELLAWLDTEVARSRPRRLVRLPVTIRFASHHLGVERAFLGAPAAQVELDLDDTTMGISLLDRLRPICDRKRDECAVWLEGYWGPALVTGPGGGPGSPPVSARETERQAHAFTVRRVLGLWSPSADANPRVEVSPRAGARP